MGDLAPDRVAEAVAGRLRHPSVPLSVFWLNVLTERNTYADHLRQAFSTEPVAVIVIRKPIFQNPNAIMADLSDTIAGAKAECQLGFDGKSTDRLGIVLLGRSSFSVPQISSPVVLPSWFPQLGGLLVSVIIEDLTWTADAPLDSTELFVDDLADALYRLDGVLVDRMLEVSKSSHQAPQQFLSLFPRDGDGKPSEVLVRFGDALRKVKVPTAYRPSLRSKDSLTARLWEAGQQRNPEDAAPAKGLARALGLDDTGLVKPSLMTVLRRPGMAGSAKENIARNIVVSISSSCQLLTAAHHASEYDRFSLQLLQSVSLDLRRSLREIERFIVTLE